MTTIGEILDVWTAGRPSWRESPQELLQLKWVSVLRQGREFKPESRAFEVRAEDQVYVYNNPDSRGHDPHSLIWGPKPKPPAREAVPYQVRSNRCTKWP